MCPVSSVQWVVWSGVRVLILHSNEFYDQQQNQMQCRLDIVSHVNNAAWMDGAYHSSERWICSANNHSIRSVYHVLNSGLFCSQIFLFQPPCCCFYCCFTTCRAWIAYKMLMLSSSFPPSLGTRWHWPLGIDSVVFIASLGEQLEALLFSLNAFWFQSLGATSFPSSLNRKLPSFHLNAAEVFMRFHAAFLVRFL